MKTQLLVVLALASISSAQVFARTLEGSEAKKVYKALPKSLVTEKANLTKKAQYIQCNFYSTQSSSDRYECHITDSEGRSMPKMTGASAEELFNVLPGKVKIEHNKFNPKLSTRTNTVRDISCMIENGGDYTCNF